MREYHHLGIPTTEPMEGEKYVPHLKIYVWGYDTSKYRIEWIRFAEGAENFYHPLMLKLPHVAFKVDDLQEELKGKKLIFGDPTNPSLVLQSLSLKRMAPLLS